MQGVILNVGEARSLILGDDGQRYAFTPLEWRRDDVEPQIGMRVDFEVRGTEAADVYPIPEATTIPGAPPAQPPTPPAKPGAPPAQPPAPPATAPGAPPARPATPPTTTRRPAPSVSTPAATPARPAAPPTTTRGTAPPKPPAPPPGDPGGRRRLYWALAAGALVVLGVVAAFALGLFGSSGPPVGREIARHAHEGQVYVLVEYGDELAVFSGSGAPVTQRGLAGDVLRSYAWGQVVAGFDTGGLAGVSDRVRRLDDDVSDARRLSNGVVAIFDELDGMKANIPLLGSISAMDVVRESFDGVEEAETLVRNLDSELNALGDNAASLSRASEGILGVEPSSVSGREMETMFAGASGAARDLESTVRDVRGFVSDTADAVADLERALRSGSDTPVIGDALGNFAVRVGRFESAMSGLSGLLGGFESELGGLAQDMEGGIESAGKALQADLDRWLAEPYDAEWPPADPDRRPAGIAQAPAASSAPTPQAAERRPAEVARAAAPSPAPMFTPMPTPTPAPTSTPAPTATPTPTPAFTSVSAVNNHTCGLREDGTVECWGDNDWGQSTPPGGQFLSVSAGGLHSCGLRDDGTVKCWGANETGRRIYVGQSSPPGGQFLSVSVGGLHNCGLRDDGTVECWGHNEYGQATPPGGQFDSVSAGSSHTCGVRDDGTVDCWGSDYFVKATPTGEFLSVSAGTSHTCGVRNDGSVECWGRNNRSMSPGGEFLSVSSGWNHTCGVRNDGSVECWGADYFGQSTPPGGQFRSVSAGYSHSCGVRNDGTVDCWGGNYAGQSTPPGG